MTAKRWLGIVLPAGLLLGLALGWASAQGPTPWPHFTRHAQGWMPSCPAGMTLIRHDPPPDCFWGTRPMRSKPTQGDMECVYPAQASKLPACPAE